MTDNQLQKTPSQDLVKRTDLQIAITNKLLSISQHSKIMVIALKQPKFFISLLSKHYPLSDSFLGKYAIEWDWSNLSRNVNLPWSIELIERYNERWDWKYLSLKEYLPWSAELIG